MSARYVFIPEYREGFRIAMLTLQTQNHTLPLVSNLDHQSHRRIQHYSSRRHPNVLAIASRRLHHRHIVHQRAGRRFAARTLHPYKSRCSIPNTILCLRAGKVQYQV